MRLLPSEVSSDDCDEAIPMFTKPPSRKTGSAPKTPGGSPAGPPPQSAAVRSTIQMPISSRIPLSGRRMPQRMNSTPLSTLQSTSTGLRPYFEPTTRKK